MRSEAALLRDKVPAVLQGPLEALWDHDDRVHVAGGAVRDTLMGKPVKDWDIFVPNNKFTLADIDAAMGDDAHDNGIHWGPQYFKWSRKITGTVEYRYDDGTLAQVVWLKPDSCAPLDNLERFDWGICKAVMVRQYLVYQHPDFLQDHQDKMFRLRALENADQFAHAMDRYGRLKAKFPDYGLEIPARFAHTHTHLTPKLAVRDVLDF